jgi:hypothetical protein
MGSLCSNELCITHTLLVLHELLVSATARTAHWERMGDAVLFTSDKNLVDIHQNPSFENKIFQILAHEAEALVFHDG